MARWEQLTPFKKRVTGVKRDHTSPDHIHMGQVSDISNHNRATHLPHAVQLIPVFHVKTSKPTNQVETDSLKQEYKILKIDVFIKTTVSLKNTHFEELCVVPHQCQAQMLICNKGLSQDTCIAGQPPLLGP